MEGHKRRVNKIISHKSIMDLDEHMYEIERGADGLEHDGYHESAKLVREAAEAAKAYYETVKPLIGRGRT